MKYKKISFIETPDESIVIVLTPLIVKKSGDLLSELIKKGNPLDKITTWT